MPKRPVNLLEVALADSVDKTTTLDTSFYVYNNQLERVAEYIGAITPLLTPSSKAIPVFVESAIVIMVTRLEHFLTSLLASAVQHRESAVRDHFRKHGNDIERPNVLSADRRALIMMVRRRINFKSNGKGIERMFQVLFGFSPWPNDDVFRLVLDLVLMRNVFVHEGDRVLEEHANQAHRLQLFKSKTYGQFTVYHVDYAQSLILLRDASVGLKAQIEHIRSQLLARPEWVYKSK
jgi:hypothetical protein